MLRRFSRTHSGLKGNNVIGIRREDKNVWERRVPLVPKHVAQLVKNGTRVLVQPSTIRCFSDEQYEEVGAEIAEDLSPASTILAVKEVPPQLLIPERTYIFFSHTIKAQPENMALLDTILAKRVRLIDYERITNQDGRIVKFGPYAGYAGMIDTLHGLGLSLLSRGIATPFLHVSPAKEYRSLDAARTDIQELGNVIRKHGLPREICPLTFVITGNGSVSMAAQQILHGLPCNYVDANDLKSLWNRKDVDRKSVYVAIAGAQHMVQRKDGGPFVKSDYYNNPKDFVPTFHTNIAPYCRVLLNSMYWDPKFHKLLTTSQIELLKDEGKFPLLAVGDITCDIMGSNEMLVRSTSIADPFFCFDLDKMEEVPMKDNRGNGVVILGVDHLPAEFPQGSSEAFGDPLVKFVQQVAVSDGTKPLPEQELPPEIERAVVTHNGTLTPNFEYIKDMRRAQEETEHDKGKHNVLVIGAGMVAGPVVEQLLSDSKVNVVIADSNMVQAEQLVSKYAPKQAVAESRVSCTLLDVTKTDVLSVLIHNADVVISLLPAHLHHLILPQCIEHKKNVFTCSYVNDNMRAFEEQMKEKGIFMLNELGLDPGIDIMSSLQAIKKIKRAGGIIESFRSICGALPSPAVSDNPLGYKFSWSPYGVLRATNRDAKFYWNGNTVTLPGQYIYDIPVPYQYFQGLHLWTVPNGDSVSYGKLYGLDERCHTLVRSTFRYSGYSLMVQTFRSLGMLDENSTVDVSQFSDWDAYIRHTLTEKLRLYDSDMTTAELLEVYLPNYFRIRIKEVERVARQAGNEALGDYLEQCGTQVPPEEKASQAITGLRALGLLGTKTRNAASIVVSPGAETLMHGLCNHLIKVLKYNAHELDYVLLMHQFEVHYPATNRRTTYTCRLAETAIDSEHTATNRTVGLPLAIAVQAFLDGKLGAALTGIHTPIMEEVYNPIMKGLEGCGIQVYQKERLHIGGGEEVPLHPETPLPV